MNQFAERLKQLRLERNLHQCDLAESIKVSGNSISRWEKNLTTPSIVILIMLCKFFDCSADYLIGLED